MNASNIASMENHIRRIREERGYTLRELADMMGYSFSQIQKLEKGERRLNFQWKQRLAEALECHPDDLEGDLPPVQVPVKGIVGAGAKVKSAAKPRGRGFSEPSTPSDFNPKKAMALIVKGNALAPLIRNGFRLYYEDKIYGVPQEFIGKICVVELENGKTYVRILRKGSKLGLYNLEALGEEKLIADARIKWSAKVRFWEQP